MNEFPIELDWVPTMYPNKLNAAAVVLKFDEDGMRQFNACVDWCHENIAPKANAQFTPSGGLKKGREIRVYGCYGFPNSSKLVKELLVYYKGCLGKVQIVMGRQARTDLDLHADRKVNFGRDAFIALKKVLARHGVDLEQLAENDVEKAMAIKKTIPSPKIWMDPTIFRRTLFDVHHLDINSAFPNGMSLAYPELRPAFEEIYAKRKEDPDMKNVLNMSFGYMQSHLVKFRWSAISKAGIEWTNEFIEQKIARLQESGRRVLGTNTDGIWYQGEVYHDEDEGKGLGQWKNDHVYCRFRAKSNGAYEFVEDGEYHPVLRGYTRLDKVKPRSTWEWGDIFDIDSKTLEAVWDPETEHFIYGYMEGD